jgi:diacylglycerol kinase family enzyme
MEVATGLLGTKVPLGILPGGTANVLARDLGIPLALADAAALLVGKHRLRPLDVGVAGDRHFVLRLAVGWEAEMDLAADRDAKDRMGILAYPVAAIDALRSLPVVRYVLDIDGERYEAEGVNCVVANSGSFGVAGLALAPDIDVSDGHLDVAVLQAADLASLLTVAKDVVAGQVPDRSKLKRWTGRSVRVTAEPAQRVVVDGEPAGDTPVEAGVLAGALRVVVPA